MMGSSSISQILNGFTELFPGKWLNHEAAGTGAHEAGLGFGIPFPAHPDNGGMGIGFLQVRQKSAISFIINIQKDELRLKGLHLSQGIAGIPVTGT